MPSLAVEVKEEEVLVLDHRSANRAAELVHMERLAHNGARVVDPRVGVHIAVAQVLKRGAMEFVRAGFGHHVSDRAARSAELGRVAITVDLELFHRIDAELVGCPSGSGPAHGLAVKIIVVVTAVHLQVVESAPQAAEAQVASAHILRDTGSEQQEFQKIPTVEAEV